MYALAEQLHNVLVENEVRYVHWKSNISIDKALNGYDDLDILIDHSDLEAFRTSICKLGFLEASNALIAFPNVFHFYGLDYGVGQLLHLHVYTKVVTGHSWIKTHVLPIENFLIDSRILYKDSFFIAAPSVEYVTSLIRIAIKFDYVSELLLLGRNIFAVTKELDYLRNRSNKDQADEFLKFCLPDIEYEMLQDLHEALRSKSYFASLGKSRKISMRLSSWKRENTARELISIIFQFAYRTANKLFLGQKKNLQKGFVIAITGLDGSGKSTLVAHAATTLGNSVNVRRIHLGKPPSSLLTMLPNMVLRVYRAIGNRRTQTLARQHTTSLVAALRYTILAWDRRKALGKARGFVSRGGVLICDRFPSSEHFGMDSRRINPSHSGFLGRYLSNLEYRIYKSMVLPDLIIRLKVPLDVALSRNRSRDNPEPEGYVKQRYEVDSNVAYPGGNIQDYLNVGSEEESKTEVVRMIWESIVEA